MSKSRFRILKSLPWKLLILSLIVAAVCAYLLREMFYPYQIKVLESIPDTDVIKIYHDFNNDGFSEHLESYRSAEMGRYYVHIKNWSGGIIDQTNYWEYFEPNTMMFADITGDGYDEVITFTQDKDSLFIYVHDIISKRAILDRFYLASPAEPRDPNDQRVAFIPGFLADENVYDHKVIIFAINSFTTLQPRTVYALDLNERRIVRKFETHSALSGFFPYDLTGDGSDEVIVSGVAYGNVPYLAEYRDDTCWLFVLDQKLSPVFPPLSFSEYPAYFTCLPAEIRSERYLLAVPDYLGEKNLSRMMYLIDSQGKVYLRTRNPFRESLEYSPVVSPQKNPFEVYGLQGNHNLIKLNNRLEIIRRVSTTFDLPQPLYIKDLNADGREEITCISNEFFSVFDSELNLLAKFPVLNRGKGFSFRETGPNKPLEIGFQEQRSFHRLGFVQNRMYSLFPLLFVGLTGVVFLLIAGVYKFAMLATLYVHIFRHFLRDTSDGVLIVNREGKILYSNNQFLQILSLPHAPSRGDYFEIIFNQYPQIVEFARKSLGENLPVRFSFDEKSTYLKIEISINPIQFLIENNFIYLVEFKSTKQLSISDKIQTWSQAVQKMAHDIKTPLSTVGLNLKVLQTRLGKIRLSESDRDELSDDIRMMRTELENIQLRTKNFLKFSNLDKPHFQAFDIHMIIEDVVKKYQAYLSDNLDIQISIDEDVKPVWADPQQVEMVFHILVENALASVQGKGIINIIVSMAQYLDKSFLEFLEIEVADTGPGIDEKDAAKIFEPYFTTKKDGTGMGLAIAKKIIEDHDGFIEVHSRPNFGAVFSFSLPALKKEETDA